MIKQLSKASFICIIILFGFLWLSGSLLEGFLPDEVTFVSGCLFGALTFITFSYQHLRTKRVENFMDHYAQLRKTTIENFESQGFHATKKFIGSERMLMIDENMGKWYLMNFFYFPESTKLYDLKDIDYVKQSSNNKYVPLNRLSITSNGVRLTSEDKSTYYKKNGIMIYLSGQEQEKVFVNCYKTDQDVAYILAYFNSLFARQSFSEPVQNKKTFLYDGDI